MERQKIQTEVAILAQALVEQDNRAYDYAVTRCVNEQSYKDSVWILAR